MGAGLSGAQLQGASRALVRFRFLSWVVDYSIYLYIKEN